MGDDLTELIRDHVHSFLARQSHYSRQDNAGKVYLSPERPIAKMYKMFLEQHDPDYIQLHTENSQRRMVCKPVNKKIRKPIVLKHMYHDIFVREFNIGFGFPRSDTCDICDSKY